MPIILYSPHFWSLKGRVVIDAPQVRFGMIRLGLFNASINNEKGFVWMNEAGTVIFHGSFAAGSGSVIKIGHPRAVLEIGDNVSNATCFSENRLSLSHKHWEKREIWMGSHYYGFKFASVKK